MDKYERFLETLIAQTESGELEWTVASVGLYQEHIYNWPLAYQCYSSVFVKEGDSHTLVLVGKKLSNTVNTDNYIDEQHSQELLIIDHGRLIFTVNDNYVSESELQNLFQLVEQLNMEASSFFSSFED